MTSPPTMLGALRQSFSAPFRGDRASVLYHRWPCVSLASPMSGVSLAPPVTGVSPVSPVTGVSLVSPVTGVSPVSPVTGVSPVSPVTGVSLVSPVTVCQSCTTGDRRQSCITDERRQSCITGDRVSVLHNRWPASVLQRSAPWTPALVGVQRFRLFVHAGLALVHAVAPSAVGARR